MELNGREITVNDREPTSDDLAQMNERYTWARMPENAKRSWSALATEFRPQMASALDFSAEAMVWDFE